MAIFSKKLLKELLVTFLVHAMLLWIGYVLMLLITSATSLEGEPDLALMYLMLFGIAGCLWDDCMLFPFAPVLAGYVIVFIIVRYSRYFKDLLVAKKKFFTIYFIVFLVVGIPIWFNVIRDYVGHRAYKKEYAADEAYYWNKYGTEEKVTASFSFISPVYHESGNKILIINPDGTEGRILEDFSSLAENVDVYYISPKGNFFIDVLFKTHDHKDEIIELTHTHSRWQWIWIY